VGADEESPDAGLQARLESRQGLALLHVVVAIDETLGDLPAAPVR
jgi:hypothetical protein